MKIILLFLILLLISIIICYFLKKYNKENFDVKGENQPEVSEEIYNYNVEQAEKIWADIVGPDAKGSYRPTSNNERIWAHESWRDELKAYVKEADKYNKEHNWFDYVPGRGKSLTIKRKDVTKEKVSPIGIRKAWKRIYGDDLGKYRFPKSGDRVRILKDDNETKDRTPYYSGIVLNTGMYLSARNAALILWDKRNNPSGGKDIKRWKTKGLRSYVTNPLVLETGAIFGWPWWHWKRHFSDNKARDSVIPSKSWTRHKDLGKGKQHGAIFDSKYLYKVVECKKKGTTGCDFLRCDKRKEAVLSDFPLTYHCARDPRNRHPGIWKCTSAWGGKYGKLYNYYDKSKMCREDYKPGKKDTFCVQDCGNRRCKPTTLQKEIEIAKKSSKSKCAYLLGDNPTRIEDGKYTLMDGDKGMFPGKSFDIKYNSIMYNGWRKYGRQSSGKWLRVPHPGIAKKYRTERYYAGNAWARFWKLYPKKRRIPLTLVKYGKGGRWQYKWGKVGQLHKCNHYGKGSGFTENVFRGHWKQCYYKVKHAKKIRIPRQNWQYSSNGWAKFSHLKNKTARSLRVYGRGCKYSTKSKTYGEGLHTNVNLKSGAVTCSMGRKAVLYQGCGYHYQDRKACRRECGGKCAPKKINLRRHGCKYGRGDKIGGKPLIPL